MTMLLELISLAEPKSLERRAIVVTVLTAVTLALGMEAPGLNAQSVSVSVAAGRYVPAGRISELSTARTFPMFSNDSAEYRREPAMAIGVSADLNMFRLSASYAPSAQVNTRGFPEQDDIGRSSVLVVAGDIVVRSPPTLGALQPYVMGGLGVKQQTFSLDRNIITYHTLATKRDLALRAGLGVERKVGRLRLSAEASDFVSRDNKAHWKTHDLFALVSVRFAR